MNGEMRLITVNLHGVRDKTKDNKIKPTPRIYALLSRLDFEPAVVAASSSCTLIARVRED